MSSLAICSFLFFVVRAMFSCVFFFFFFFSFHFGRTSSLASLLGEEGAARLPLFVLFYAECKFKHNNIFGSEYAHDWLINTQYYRSVIMLAM